MNIPESITFFYPSRIVGGAEYLFIRMARYISESTIIPVYVVDYKDGFLRKQLQGTSVTILDYSDKKQFHIEHHTTVVTSFNHFFEVTHFNTNGKRVKIFFWSIHPTHFTAYFPNRNWFLKNADREKIATSFQYLIQHHAMVFMDEPNYIENASFLKLPLKSIPFLPIPADRYKGTLKQYHYNPEINICWLGRIAVDKVNSIINIARHINSLPHHLRDRINFTIIGSGEKEKELIEALAKLNIRYELKGTLINEELDNFLVNQVDIAFAMGTSVLEFAKHKIPVVLVDMFVDTIPDDNRFQWFYDSQGFSLGAFYSSSAVRNITMKDVLEIVDDEGLYNKVGLMCYEYYKQHHEIESITHKLLDYLSKDQISIDDYELQNVNSIMNPWFFKQLKSLKNRFVNHS